MTSHMSESQIYRRFTVDRLQALVAPSDSGVADVCRILRSSPANDTHVFTGAGKTLSWNGSGDILPQNVEVVA